MESNRYHLLYTPPPGGHDGIHLHFPDPTENKGGNKISLLYLERRETLWCCVKDLPFPIDTAIPGAKDSEIQILSHNPRTSIYKCDVILAFMMGRINKSKQNPDHGGH